MPVTRTYNKPARAKIYKFYVNERDLEKPKLQKKLVRGYIDYNDNKELIELKDIEFPKVRDEVWDLYKVDMIDSKSKLLEAEFDKLAKHLLEKNNDQTKQRIEALAKYLWSNKYILSNFAKFAKKKWSLKGDFLTAFNVTELERKDIEKLLQAKVKEEKDELNFRGLDDGQGNNE